MGASVNIMLGTACNWRCSYCLQTDEKGFNVKHDPDVFVDKFRKYIIDNKIEIKRIAYWGGEPCLYWDQVKTIDLQLQDLVQQPSRFITNGSLINDEHIRFLNQQQMLVNVSYHQGELSDDQWKQCFKIRRLYITSLIHHKCLTFEPYYQKWQYLYDKFGRCVSWYVFPLKYTNGMTSEYALTSDDIDQYIEYLYSIVEKCKTNIFYKRMMEILFYTFYEHDYDPSYYNFCYNKNVISVDLLGNRYFCHHDCNHNNIVANIFDQIPIYNDTLFFDKIRSKRQQCIHCPLYQRCIGGCFRDQSPTTTCYFKLKMYNFLKYIKTNYSDIVDSKYLNYID